MKNLFGFWLVFTFFGNVFSEGRVVVVTGTQSCGKTSIAKILSGLLDNVEVIHADNVSYNAYAGWAEKKLEEKYNIKYKLPRNDPDAIHKSIATLIEKNPHVNLKISRYEDEEEKVFKDAEEKMFLEITKFSKNGFDVICDAIADEKLYREKLGALPLYFVLIYCPLEELEKRIIKRNKTLIDYPTQKRVLMDPLIQFLDIYDVADEPDSQCLFNVVIEKDSALLSVSRIDHILNKAEKQFEEENLPWKKELWRECKNKWSKFKEKVLETMIRNKKNVFALKSRFIYNLIVDNGKNCSPLKCAQKIKKACML